MELVDKLREESSSEHVAYTEFILKLKRNTTGLFCFFEGKEDNKYYGIRIKNITQEEYNHINCGGKENVIKVHELISAKPEYQDINTAYYIDSDFQGIAEIPDIYCLPSYSIENQYVKRTVLESILKNEFSLQEDSDDFKKIIDCYNTLLSKFHEKSLLVNSYLACQSDKRTEFGIKTHLKIDSTIGTYFKGLVKSQMNAIADLEELNDLTKLNSYFVEAPTITQDEIDEKIGSFNGTDQSSTFRGKFELSFFIDFLNKLQSEIGKKSSTIFKNRHKCSLRFEFPTALTNLSIYAETPECLVLYLEQYKKSA